MPKKTHFLDIKKGFTTQKSRKSTKWAIKDLNFGPRDYESPALTTELMARVN